MTVRLSRCSGNPGPILEFGKAQSFCLVKLICPDCTSSWPPRNFPKSCISDLNRCENTGNERYVCHTVKEHSKIDIYYYCILLHWHVPSTSKILRNVMSRYWIILAVFASDLYWTQWSGRNELIEYLMESRVAGQRLRERKVAIIAHPFEFQWISYGIFKIK